VVQLEEVDWSEADPQKCTSALVGSIIRKSASMPGQLGLPISSGRMGMSICAQSLFGTVAR
jgi:hypothetical protein